MVVALWPRLAHADDVSLEDAIKGALKSHERTRIAALNVEAAEGDVESARADFLPSLTLGAQVGVAPSEDERYVTGSGTLSFFSALMTASMRWDISNHCGSPDRAQSSCEKRRRCVARGSSVR